MLVKRLGELEGGWEVDEQVDKKLRDCNQERDKTCDLVLASLLAVWWSQPVQELTIGKGMPYERAN
jgi:cytidylate kinase